MVAEPETRTFEGQLWERREAARGLVERLERELQDARAVFNAWEVVYQREIKEAALRAPQRAVRVPDPPLQMVPTGKQGTYQIQVLEDKEDKKGKGGTGEGAADLITAVKIVLDSHPDGLEHRDLVREAAGLAGVPDNTIVSRSINGVLAGWSRGGLVYRGDGKVQWAKNRVSP